MQTALIGDLETAVRRHHAGVNAARETTAQAKAPGYHRQHPLPLLIQAEASNTSLADWISSKRDQLSAHLLKHGGILFRGF
ncbi:MAG TPA: hypothetical protein VGW32_00755, partial [Pyrinomonadaceae bacterium]|nr:hypothetical protein [Pyrinomonadaceae bacterium]